MQLIAKVQRADLYTVCSYMCVPILQVWYTYVGMCFCMCVCVRVEKNTLKTAINHATKPVRTLRGKLEILKI